MKDYSEIIDRDIKYLMSLTLHELEAFYIWVKYGKDNFIFKVYEENKNKSLEDIEKILSKQ